MVRRLGSKASSTIGTVEPTPHLRSPTRCRSGEALRIKGLEIVDDRGTVRAQIVVQPNDGGVLFRLIDQQRKPLVMLGAGADGSGLMLTGDPARQDWSGIQVLAKPGGSTLRLLNVDGKERVIKPE